MNFEHVNCDGLRLLLHKMKESSVAASNESRKGKTSYGLL